MDISEITECLECNGSNVKEITVEQQFQYGINKPPVVLVTTFPVFSCTDCGFEFFDERGAQARDVAVCLYLIAHQFEVQS